MIIRHSTLFTIQNSSLRNNKFQLNAIDNTQTWNIIKTLTSKTSSGFDEISPKLVKSCASNLAPPLTLIINRCFETGNFPKKLKLAKISPIHKKGEREPGNFRPISELPTFSKVIEKAANIQLRDYLEKTFEDKFQFAYRRSHSTIHPIIYSRQLIEEHLKKNHYVLLIMIDLSLAFDCIETSTILPEKLSHYGATAKTTAFFKNFFTGRTHLTNWFGESSETLELSNHSCVQGSCLGAPIFNVYTRNLQSVTDSTIVSFADDTNVIVHHKNPNELIKLANQEIAEISNFMAANYLLINSKKTQCLLFTPKNKKPQDLKEKLMINGQELQLVEQARYLGVTLDSKLSFKPQVNSLISKLNNATRALMATRRLLNRRSKLLLYNALFKANLEYGLIAYGDKLTSKQSNTISKLQKQSIRLIFNAKPKVHTKKLYEIAKILPAKEAFKAEAMKLVFKNTNELTRSSQPKLISNLINKSKKYRTTRLSQDPSKIQMKSKTPGTLIYKISKIWNEASQDLRNSGSYMSLNRALKSTAISSLDECKNSNCQTCFIDKNTKYV